MVVNFIVIHCFHIHKLRYFTNNSLESCQNQYFSFLRGLRLMTSWNNMIISPIIINAIIYQKIKLIRSRGGSLERFDCKISNCSLAPPGWPVHMKICTDLANDEIYRMIYDSYLLLIVWRHNQKNLIHDFWIVFWVLDSFLMFSPTKSDVRPKKWYRIYFSTFSIDLDQYWKKWNF